MNASAAVENTDIAEASAVSANETGEASDQFLGSDQIETETIPVPYEAADVRRICEGLNTQNRMAKVRLICTTG